MAGRRRFGRVRRLPSGRWQARYSGPDGIDRPAPGTFATKTDADVWLTMQEAEIRTGDWLDPDAGTVLFENYASSWVAERPNLRPKTAQLYEGLVRLHLEGYAKLSLKKYRPIAARNEDANVFRGLL